MNWNLEVLYPTVETWNQAFNTFSKRVDDIPSFEGTLKESSSFKTYFMLQKDTLIEAHKLYQYAALKSDLNKKDVENASRVQKMAVMLSRLSQVTAFERPELLSLGQDYVLKTIQAFPELSEYHFPMIQLFHAEQYVLSKDQEGILANFSTLSQAGSNLHSALSTADRTETKAILKNGETITITSGNYRAYLADLEDEDDRKTVFEAFFKHYSDSKNTYAEIFKNVLDNDVARMRSRKYASSLEMYLHGKNIDPSVYHNIVEVAYENTELLKRYYEIRKKALGLSTHHTYDRFRHLAESSTKYTYAEAKDLFFKSIAHLGDSFNQKAHQALEDGFVDVYEKEGKRTGAYSWSAINEHPYILLNYNDTLDSVFTLAHEAGHSMHSLYAMEHQPPAIQNYTIFVAEIASTFNEHVLLDYVIQNNPGSVDDKIALLQQSIDDIMATFYRQVLFATYELRAHELAEKGEPITHESLSKIMIDLYQHYYDIDIAAEPGKQFVWAYIPHLFNTPFYVYQYATSFAASLKLYEMVKEDPKNIEKHQALLASGGSDWPLNQTAAIGINLTTKEPFLAVVSRLKTLLDALELALKEKAV